MGPMLLVGLGLAAARAEPVFVLSPSLEPPPTTLELDRLLLGTQRATSAGTPLRLVLPPRNHPALAQCVERRLDMPLRRFERHWLGLSLRGAATPPRQLPVADAVHFLSVHASAVTILDASEVPEGWTAVPCADA